MFIKDNKVNVVGLILAGAADLKREIPFNEWIDYRLPPLVLKIVDVCYGEENGFNQAIELSRDVVSGLKFIKEKKILSGFFNEISIDSGKFVYGTEDTMKLFETGCIETLIIWDNLPHYRITCKLPESDAKDIIYCRDQEEEKKKLIDNDSGIEREIIDKTLLAEWILENYKENGMNLEIVTDKSAEGNQFCLGFGGLGGVLRYKNDENMMEQVEYISENEDDFI